MEVKAFSRFHSLQQFLKDERRIHIKKVLLNPQDIGGHNHMTISTEPITFYVFYENKQDMLSNEYRRLFELVDTAREVSTREDYYTLKTVKQREMYLLQEFGLVKKDAEDVIELLKPEMAAIFKHSEYHV